MNAIIFLMIAVVLGLCAVCTYLVKQVDKLFDVAAKQAVKISDHESIILMHDEKIKVADYKIADLEKSVSEIPVEDLRAQHDAEKAWNDGVQSILSFGLDSIKKGDS